MTQQQENQEHVIPNDPVLLDEILDSAAKEYDASTVAVMRRADLDAVQDQARKHPRVLSAVLAELEQVCTLNQRTAEACLYSLPRGGKKITGPSVRFAELVAYAWGSIRVSSTIVAVEDNAVVVNGVAHDLQTNRVIEVQIRRLVQKKKNAAAADDDDKQLAVSSGTSIAVRNAILRLVPRALLEQALDAAKRAATGKGTIEQRRADAVRAFASVGVDEAGMLTAIGRAGIEDVSIDDLVYLRGLLTAIKEGTIRPEDAARSPEDRRQIARGRAVVTKKESPL